MKGIRWFLQGARVHYGPELTPKSDLDKFLVDLINEDYTFPLGLEAYPAHLHIDLLPVAQNKGFGRMLIETFIEAFIEAIKIKGESGVHLAVGLDNAKHDYCPYGCGVASPKSA